MNKNIVIFKGIQDGILIVLNNKVYFDDVENALLQKVQNAKTFFKGANKSISFKGRDLSEDEENRLLDIISNVAEINISFVNNIPTIISEEQQETVTEVKNDNITEDSAKLSIPNVDTSNTYFHKGSLRNGQKINYKGNVVVIGDINPGGSVVADGNVIVLGKLKGTVHAGLNRDKNCFISALRMTPSQLIIGDCLAYFPTDIKRDVVPEYAYTKDNQIFVKPLI